MDVECHVFSCKKSLKIPKPIRIRKSKNRQHNLQKKKYKRTNNDLQNIHIKLKMELHECLNPDLTTIRDYVKGYRLLQQQQMKKDTTNISF